MERRRRAQQERNKIRKRNGGHRRRRILAVCESLPRVASVIPLGAGSHLHRHAHAHHQHHAQHRREQPRCHTRTRHCHLRRMSMTPPRRHTSRSSSNLAVVAVRLPRLRLALPPSRREPRYTPGATCTTPSTHLRRAHPSLPPTRLPRFLLRVRLVSLWPPAAAWRSAPPSAHYDDSRSQSSTPQLRQRDK